MSMKYIRSYYGVPAKVGMTIIFKGEPVVITGANGALLRAKREDGTRLMLHPEWEIVYPYTPPK
jgi:hypothetical protein